MAENASKDQPHHLADNRGDAALLFARLALDFVAIELANQRGDGVRRLRAHAKPVIITIALKRDRRVWR